MKLREFTVTMTTTMTITTTPTNTIRPPLLGVHDDRNFE